jgi:hypothetical protein
MELHNPSEGGHAANPMATITQVAEAPSERPRDDWPYFAVTADS